MTFISDNVHENFKDEVIKEYARKYGEIRGVKRKIGDDIMDELVGSSYEFDDRLPLDIGFSDASEFYNDVEDMQNSFDYIRKKHIFSNLDAIPDSIRKDERTAVSSRRVSYNREVYKKLISMMRGCFYKEHIENDTNKDVSLLSIYQNDMNVGMLSVPFALTYLNVYFELIYSDISDYFKRTKFEGAYDSSLDYDKEAKDFSIFLLDKYNGDVAVTGEIISEAIGKFFTDNKIGEMAENTPGRQTIRNLRKYFPQIPARSKTTKIKELRNLSSHGDYELVNQNGSLVLEKDGESFSMNHILGLVDGLSLDISANGRSRFADYFVKGKYLESDEEFLRFLKSNTNSEANLDNCGFDDKKTLDMLVLASFYSLLQYNVQHHFKQMEDVKSDDVDRLNFNKLFELEQDGGIVLKAKSGDLSRESLLYNKYDYLKNAMGHGNLHVTDKGIIGFNTKGYTLINISVFDALEYITQPEFYSAMVCSPDMHHSSVFEDYHSGEAYKQECRAIAEKRISYHKMSDRENTSGSIYA